MKSAKFASQTKLQVLASSLECLQMRGVAIADQILELEFEMTLAEGLWDGLPFEIVEQVLAFLSVPDLCRYRAVCKEWNHLLCERQFVTRYTQNTKDSDAAFIMVRYYDYGRWYGSNGNDSKLSDLERVVSIFDVKARRWYTVLRDDERRVGESEVLVADGGLACQFEWKLPNALGSQLKPLIVYNPIARTQDCIPPTYLQDCFGCSNPVTAMAVDMTTQKYKIFLNDRGSVSAQAPFMLVYDSCTKEWVTASEPPKQVRRNTTTMCMCSLAYQDKLYILISCGYVKYRLLSYNISQDTWDEEGLEIDGRNLHDPQLIASGNRIYLKTWSCWRHEQHKERRGWQLEVWEMLIPEKKCVTVFEMATELVLEVFGAECADRYRGRYACKCPDMNAFVFGNLIVLMARLSGVCLQYDMETGSRDVLPRNPLGPPSGALGHDAYRCFGKQTNLRLPTA